MTVDPSDTNPTGSEDSTLEDIMWQIQYFEILQKTKGLFLVWTLGLFFLALQMSFLEFGFSILVLQFFLAKSVVLTLGYLSLTLSILESQLKIIPPSSRIISEANKIRVKIPSGGFFTFCKVNVYGLECFRRGCHEILSIISVTLLPSG